MVECEFFENPYNFLGFYVLIDTWWNVNLIIKSKTVK